MSITTIPDMLVASYGNITTVANQLDRQRNTVRKYARDFKGKQHRVIDGVLFTVGKTGRK